MGAALEESGSLRAKLTEEAATLATRIQAQSEQARRLRALAERIEVRTAEDRHALRDLEGVLGEAVQLGIDDFDRRLGGQRLERVAIRLLHDHDGGEEIHYRAWFNLIRDAGYEVSGKNPLGTFLAQLNRSASVERVGNRSGLYRLRLAA